MKRKYKRLCIIVFSFLVISIGIISLLEIAKDNIVFFFSPSELKNKKNIDNKIIRIGGIVKKDTIINKSGNVKFVLTDNNCEITVTYDGPIPNLFRDGQGVVAKGILKEDFFQADELLAKHDENYMPKEVAEAIKKSGQWKG